MSLTLKSLFRKPKLINSFLRNVSSSAADTPRILITGGLGQLGAGLADKFGDKYGKQNVIVSDINKPKQEFFNRGIQYMYADVLDLNGLKQIVANNKIDWVVHFSALLSAIGEQNVPLAISININGMQNILELARYFNLKVFIPSTIGAFGPESPRDLTPDLCIQRPKTIYGVSKVYAELLGEYYAHKYNVDFRCLRFPGIISADSEPGGGTTDYAVKVFHDALSTGHHECYLQPDTRLPMMYLDDCLMSVVKFMEADLTNQRTYNINAMSFTPEEIFSEIKKHVPELKVTYNVDSRQAIADSWPKCFDDSNARADWNWNPEFGSVDKLVQKMFKELKKN